MRGRDGEDQERRQHVHRVDAEAHQLQRAQHPHHRDQGRGHGQGRELARGRIQEQQQPGEGDGEREELDHRARAIADVADDLGETDDVDRVVVVLVLLPDRLELVGDLLVVDLVEIAFGDEVGPDHRAGPVLGHQAADDVGLDDVAADGLEVFRRGLEALDVRGEGLRDDVAARQAVLDHFDEAHVRREQRARAGVVGGIEVDDLVGDVLQGLHELLVEHVAVLRDHGHEHAVGAAELELVILEGLHVLVLQRHLLLEAGVHLELAGEIQHRQGDRREDDEDQRPVAENEVLGETGERTGLAVGQAHCFSVTAGGTGRRPCRRSRDNRRRRRAARSRAAAFRRWRSRRWWP